MAMNNPDPLLGADLEDDEVREAVKQLALEVLRGTIRMYKMGDPSLRMQISKAIMPALVRTLNKDAESEEIAELKVRLTEMQADIRGSTSTRLKVVNSGIPEDKPRSR